MVSGTLARLGNGVSECVRLTPAARQVLEAGCDTQVSLLRAALDERDRSLKRLRADLEAAETSRDAADTRCRAADAAAADASAAAEAASARAVSLDATALELQAALAQHMQEGRRAHALLGDAAAAQDTINALEAELADARAAAARRAAEVCALSTARDSPQRRSGGHAAAGGDDGGVRLRTAKELEAGELRMENERLRGLLRERGKALVSLRREAVALQVRASTE